MLKKADNGEFGTFDNGSELIALALKAVIKDDEDE